MLYLYAIYLLAQFREKQAFLKIIELVSLPPDDVEWLFGDIITESLPSLLYSTFNGDLSLLQKTVENQSILLTVQGACLDTLGKLYSDGVISREFLVQYLREIIAKRAGDPNTDPFFFTYIQGVVAERDLKEMVPAIKKLYEENLIDPIYFGDFAEYQHSVGQGDSGEVRYIEDIAAEIGWWACFRQPKKKQR